jgi:hypothetical protein
VRKLSICGLIRAGGDGSLTIAQQVYEKDNPDVGVPKTIDNDLGATAFTFGFDSAVHCATDALDRLHATASSHGRVMARGDGPTRRLNRPACSPVSPTPGIRVCVCGSAECSSWPARTVGVGDTDLRVAAETQNYGTGDRQGDCGAWLQVVC